MGSSVMLGCGRMPYRPKSAQESTMWPLIALAAQKRYLFLYVCAVVDGGYLAEARGDRLGANGGGGPWSLAAGSPARHRV